MLQFVCYPTYTFVGDKEFVPFHVSFGRRLIAAAVVPMVLTCLGTFALLFLRPAAAPMWTAIVAAVCGAVILLTTVVLEVPKHLKLDKEGKSDAVLQALVRDNIPRTLAWTVASLVLAYALWVSLPA
ncbi:MAG: hypothetical protein JNM70_13230 [Anaerolineae bacterium]|nr:hypothetical protein [Anaerolineae bacterium]